MHLIFQERTYSVLIVSASEKLDNSLRALLPGTEYYPVQSARSVGEARRLLLGSSFDLVLINTPLKDDFGTQLAIDVCVDSRRLCRQHSRRDAFCQGRAL